VSLTARRTGDWTGAASIAALAGLSDAIVERTEAAQREIARLNAMIDVRDKALEARDADVAERDAMLLARAAELWNAKAELREERRIGRHRQTLRGWLAMPLSRVKSLFARSGPR